MADPTPGPSAPPPPAPTPLAVNRRDFAPPDPDPPGMSTNTAGWILFATALGSMLGLVGVDIAALESWAQMTTPVFVGTTLAKVGSIIVAFLGGKIMPTPQPGDRRR